MKNKEKIFQRLLIENKDKIYRICYAYLYDCSEVEDLYQDILLNIWKSLERFREESQLSTWVYRISVNTALTYNKRRKRKEKLFTYDDHGIQDFPSETQLPEKKIREKELDQLANCISQLEKQDRLIIGMLLEGVSYKEIAQVMGMTSNYVGVRINRIKGKLNKMMKKYSYGVS